MSKANVLFAKYEDECERALKALSRALVPKVQELLAIAQDAGEFYVCTGMGICNLSCEKFKVIYSDEPGVSQDCDDDFELGEKLKPLGESRYAMTVDCSNRARKALLEVAEICEKVTDDDIQQVFPFKIYSNRIEP